MSDEWVLLLWFSTPFVIALLSCVAKDLEEKRLHQKYWRRMPVSMLSEDEQLLLEAEKEVEEFLSGTDHTESR